MRFSSFGLLSLMYDGSTSPGERGGANDLVCFIGLVSTLWCELSELHFIGVARYAGISLSLARWRGLSALLSVLWQAIQCLFNPFYAGTRTWRTRVTCVEGARVDWHELFFLSLLLTLPFLLLLCSALLAAAFYTRLYGPSDEESYRALYAPESVFLAGGLALSWIRVFMRVMGEFEPTAILIMILHETIVNDFAKFTCVAAAFFVAFGLAGSALLTVVTCDHESFNSTSGSNSTVWDNRFDQTCYLQQTSGALTPVYIVVAQLIWPVLTTDVPGGIEDSYHAQTPSERADWGPAFTALFSVLFIGEDRCVV